MAMFVELLVADIWTGVDCEEEEVRSPSIPDLEYAITALDASVRTTVCLYGIDGSFLTIGGGGGQYVVYVTTPDEQFWNLLAEDSDLKGIILINIGGQEGDFPARQVVNEQRALQASRTFFRSGELDSSLRWEVQV